jgi:hypothetical protein
MIFEVRRACSRAYTEIISEILDRISLVSYLCTIEMCAPPSVQNIQVLSQNCAACFTACGLQHPLRSQMFNQVTSFTSHSHLSRFNVQHRTIWSTVYIDICTCGDPTQKLPTVPWPNTDFLFTHLARFSPFEGQTTPLAATALTVFDAFP